MQTESITIKLQFYFLEIDCILIVIHALSAAIWTSPFLWAFTSKALHLTFKCIRTSMGSPNIYLFPP